MLIKYFYDLQFIMSEWSESESGIFLFIYFSVSPLFFVVEPKKSEREREIY